MNENDNAAVDRAEGFRDAVAEMPVQGGAMARERQLAALGMVLLVAGPIVALIAYVLSHGTTNPLLQRDAIVIALLAITVSILGLALFLRYSLGGILRLWLARAVAERD